MPTDRKIGLIAGWGRYPVVLAESLRQQGFQVYCLGIRNHADPALKEICFDYCTVGIARLGAHIRYFRRRGVKRATMAGKLFKTLLFEKLAWLRHLPDLTCLRYFYPHFITKSQDCKDDSIVLTMTRAYADQGITFAPATDFVPQLLVAQETLSTRKPTGGELGDIRFAWTLAKEMGRLDVGQTVAVKNKAVLAVEAVEGTDECIRRAGQLCPSGGFTVVKVSKPQQDMRFDVPTIGVRTLKTMRDAGASVLAVEANKTVLLDKVDVEALANRHQIAIVAVIHDDLFLPQRSS